MNDNTCGECRYFATNGSGGCCTFICDAMCDDDRVCDNFQKPTLFDRITASPEVLAEKFVIKECNRYGGCSYKAILLVDENGNYRDFYSREKAIAATVAKLKEVCDE